SDIWILTQSSDFPVIDRDQVAVVLIPGSVLVGDVATTLADRITQELDLLNATAANEVVVFGTVEVPPAPPPPPPPPPPLPVEEFVTITPIIVKPPVFQFEFWFHPQVHFRQIATLQPFSPQRVELVEERSGLAGRAFQVHPQPITNVMEYT